MAFFFSSWNLSEDQLPAPLPRPYCAREAPAAMLAGPMEPWLGPYMEPWLVHYTEAEIALLEEMLGDRSAALWPQVQEQAARTCHTPLSEPPGSSRPQDCSPIAGPLSERPMVVCADAMFLCLDIFPKGRKEAWERKPVPPVLCHVSRAVKQRPKLALADTELGSIVQESWNPPEMLHSHATVLDYKRIDEYAFKKLR